MRAAKFLSALLEAQADRDQARHELATLEARLGGMLSAEQLDAAKISNCPPVEYALQWFKLLKLKDEERALESYEKRYPY